MIEHVKKYSMFLLPWIQNLNWNEIWMRFPWQSNSTLWCTPIDTGEDAAFVYHQGVFGSSTNIKLEH